MTVLERTSAENASVLEMIDKVASLPLLDARCVLHCRPDANFFKAVLTPAARARWSTDLVQKGDDVATVSELEVLADVQAGVSTSPYYRRRSAK